VQVYTTLELRDDNTPQAEHTKIQTQVSTDTYLYTHPRLYVEELTNELAQGSCRKGVNSHQDNP
jgi:hypothetical protein